MYKFFLGKAVFKACLKFFRGLLVRTYFFACLIYFIIIFPCLNLFKTILVCLLVRVYLFDYYFSCLNLV